MSNKTNHLQGTRDLWWRCGTVLAAFLAVAVIKWITLDLTIKNSQADGDLINLSGRQRMLTQRMGKALLGFRLAEPKNVLSEKRYWNDLLSETYYDFCRGHEAVRDRRSSAGLTGSHSAQVQAKLAELEPIYQRIRRMGAEIGAKADRLKTTAVSIVTAEQISQVMELTDDYLTKIDSITYRLADESRYRIIEARQLLRWGIALTTLLALALASFVLAPAIRRFSGSLTRINTIFETAGEGILVSDSAGNIQRANSKAEQILSRKGNQFEQSTIFDCFDFSTCSVLKSDRHSPDSNTDLILSGYRTVGHGPEGTSIPIELSVSKTLVQGDTCLVTIFRDVSERLQLEEELSHARKMTAIGELSAGISHEINSPMQYISDNVNYIKESLGKLFGVVECYEQLLMDNTARTWKERQKEIQAVIEDCNLERLQANISDAVADCQQGVDKTAAIIQTISEFSRISDDDFEPIDLKSALDSALSIATDQHSEQASFGGRDFFSHSDSK